MFEGLGLIFMLGIIVMSLLIMSMLTVMSLRRGASEVEQRQQLAMQ